MFSCSCRSLGQAAPDVSAFVRAKAAAYPIFQMIERDTAAKTSAKSGRKLSKVDGHIQFTDVTFSYPSRPDVLIFDKLNLAIPAGKMVALVGGSGSGKSTIISLIERFYEPTSGAVLLDGSDIKELDIKWLRGHIGLVSQEPALFATTIRENIMYGKDDATDEEVGRAAKLSEAFSFINNLPEGVETQVSQNRNLGTHETTINPKFIFYLFLGWGEGDSTLRWTETEDSDIKSNPEEFIDTFTRRGDKCSRCRVREERARSAGQSYGWKNNGGGGSQTLNSKKC